MLGSKSWRFSAFVVLNKCYFQICMHNCIHDRRLACITWCIFCWILFDFNSKPKNVPCVLCMVLLKSVFSLGYSKSTTSCLKCRNETQTYPISITLKNHLECWRWTKNSPMPCISSAQVLTWVILSKQRDCTIEYLSTQLHLTFIAQTEWHKFIIEFFKNRKFIIF